MRSSTALMAALPPLLLLLVSLATAEDIHIPDRERSQEEMRRTFVEWKAKVGKTYSSVGEEERHYATFKDKLRDIDQKNATGEEFRACCFLLPDHDDERKRAWILIAYLLFGCGFILYLRFFVLQPRNP